MKNSVVTVSGQSGFFRVPDVPRCAFGSKNRKGAAPTAFGRDGSLDQPRSVARRLGRLALFVFILGTKLTGALAADGPAAVDPRGDEEIRIQRVFTSHLPDTMRERDLRMWIHPHFGDLKNRDHLRSSAGVRYGLTRWWEIGASTDIYFGHGIGDTRFGDKYGTAGFQLATKFNFGRRRFLGWDTAVGADIDIPVGHPPAEVTDGIRHYGPWATFSRRWDSRPSVRIFWGVGADIIRQTTIAATYGRNQFLDHNARATSGVVVDQGRLHYTFEFGVSSNRVIGSGHDDVITMRPGIIWEVPPPKEFPGEAELGRRRRPKCAIRPQRHLHRRLTEISLQPRPEGSVRTVTERWTHTGLET